MSVYSEMADIFRNTHNCGESAVCLPSLTIIKKQLCRSVDFRCLEPQAPISTPNPLTAP